MVTEDSSVISDLQVHLVAERDQAYSQVITAYPPFPSLWKGTTPGPIASAFLQPCRAQELSDKSQHSTKSKHLGFSIAEQKQQTAKATAS